MKSFRTHLTTGLLLRSLFLAVALAAVMVLAFRPASGDSLGSWFVAFPTDTLGGGSSARSAGEGLLPADTGRGEVGDVPTVDSVESEPLSAPSDTAAVSDTVHVTPVDSSARVAHFQYRRTDPIYADAFPSRLSPFFLKNNFPGYRRDISLDSTGAVVTVRETVAGEDVKIPITIPLEDYIQRRLHYEQRRRWETMASEYRSKDGEAGLQNIFGTFTNIDIPVPANPLLSIFGPPRINLKISGAVDIRAAFRSQKSDQTTISRFDQVRNEPDFKQEVQINLNGTIGDKLNILADWNTQRVFEYENQLRVKYTGYEDEIVQSIEAGNVSLASPSTFVGSSQALFGIKAKFQTGPLTLTTLVSQKKGQTRELTVTGGATVRPFELRAHQYSSSHYFLDTLYRKFYEPLKATTSPTYTFDMQRNRIKDIEVWISQPVSQQPRPDARQVVAFIDLPGILATQTYDSTLRNVPNEVPGRIEIRQFIKLRPGEYALNQYAGVLTLNMAVDAQQAVGVAYRVEGDSEASGDDIFFGEFAGSDTSRNRLILKLVKPRNLLPSFRPAWDMLLKNVYPLGGRDIKKEDFDLKVLREIPGGASVDQILGQSFLRILGLDRFDETNAPLPDDKFDFLPGLTIDLVRGEIIFPTLEPFRTNIRSFFSTYGALPDSSDYIYHEIYDTTTYAAAQNRTRDRYIIKGQFVSERASKYNLGFNLVEGSVRVLLNGSPLNPNVDYTVDYIIGEVVIRNAAALLPGANLEIKYEQNDLFQLASKTLIGARGELSPFPNAQLGFTVMNLNQQTLSDKVRLGEEPTSNTIFGVDGSTTVELPALTSALNYIPIYQSREVSTIRLTGEAAYMLPDPNTKKSAIPSDRGSAVAYIDDFEGARRMIPLGVGYTLWKPASPPVAENVGGLERLLKTDSKAKLNWYNILPSDVFSTDIWPNRSVRRGEERITVLNLDFYPTRRGMYNYSLNLDSTMVPANRNWNGVMRYLSMTGSNILDQNIGFLEIWMRVDAANINDIRNGKLYVDLGLISEDVIPNGILNSEDLVVDNIPNGVLNPGEDVGLDMLTDDQERIALAELIQRYPELAGDPSGDNYSYATGSPDFDGINGPEGNQFSPEGNFPNTEDINGNFQLDLVNSYLQYALPLDTVYVDSTGNLRPNPYIVGGGAQRWYQFRIPLVDPTSIVSLANQTPQDILQNLQFVRLWLSGFSENVRVRIADINLIGNQWQELARNDTVLKVSVVNIEDNPSYTSPPGVIRERDRTQPDQEIFANEQSLALILNGLPADSSRQVVKYYPIRALDLFNYKSLRMFVHGDPRFFYNSSDHTDYDAALFLRFGSDTANFYEYRQPIRPGWEGNDVEVDFTDITAIKAQRQLQGDSVNVLSPPYPVRNRPDAEYRVRGNPALTNIRYIGLGIYNNTSRRLPPGSRQPLSGEVWVNELRVIDVDNRPGTAYRFDAQIKLADLGNVSFNYSRIDPNFHGLEQRFGSRTTNINWGIGVNLGFEKFLPYTWQGTSIPFTYTHTENMVKPKYLPNTDVLVDEAAGRAPTPEAAGDIVTAAQTFRVTDSYAVPNVRLGLPSQAWYIRDTFNKLSLSYNYTKTRERNPTVQQRSSWLWSGRITYAVTLSPDYHITPFKDLFDGVFLLDTFKDWKLYYAPSSFNAGVGLNRSRTYDRIRGITEQRPTTRSFTASRSLGFGYKLTEGGLSNLSGDYSLNIESSLAHLETDSTGRQRRSSEILRDLFFSDRFINFGNDARYAQRFSINSRPRIPTLFDLNKFMELTMSYGVNYNWQNNFQRGDLDKAAGFDNNITVNMSFRLKAFTDPWFASTPAGAPPPGRSAPGRGRESQRPPAAPDTTTVDESKRQEPVDTVSVFDKLKAVVNYAIKVPFLEYDNINLSFTQTNRATHGGVVGTAGFLNFWGRVPFFQSHIVDYGPSRLYQLGLITDPSGTLKLTSRSAFPFFGFTTERGVRARNASLTDQFGQTNRLSMRTNRAMWEGATIDLNWNVGWTFNQQSTITTDSILGMPRPGAITTSGSVERSYFTIPPVLFFKAFKSDLEDVARKYGTLRANKADTRSEDAKLAQAFEEGLEALPLFKKIFGPFFPRVNYTFRWDGLQRVLSVSDYFDRLAVEHAYTSSFTRQWRGNPDGGERTDAERVTIGFAPLLGVNASMKNILDGTVNANLRFNTSTSYDLNVAARNIVETFSREISVTLGYARRGFEFFLFGVSLSNDLDVGVTYSLTKNSRRTYDVNILETNTEGKPLEGSTRTVLEPRIRYVLSARVTASIFYRYTSVAPDEGGSLIPGTTTNEAGLDIHIAIQ